MPFIMEVAILERLLNAQAPPPPPGVPLDFGLSALIAGCVGYGVVKMREKNQESGEE